MFADRVHRLVANGMGLATANTPMPPSLAEAQAAATADTAAATKTPPAAEVGTEMEEVD